MNMLDIKIIRNDFENVKNKLKTRGVDGSTLDSLLDLDEKRRAHIQKSENLKKKRNDVSSAIANKKRNKENADDDIKEMKEVGVEIKTVDADLEKIEEQIEDIAAGLPNLPHESVPVGADEDDNVEISRWGDEFLPEFAKGAKAHWDIGDELDILDFDRGAKVSGSRFLYYKGLGARLERALYNFMLDMHTGEHGYRELITPFLVNDDAMYGTSQFPKFKEDVFEIDGVP